MPSAKRERQKAGRAARQEAMRAMQKRRARQRQIVTFVLIVGVTVGVLLLLGVFSNDEGGEEEQVATTNEKSADCPKKEDQEPRKTFPAAQRKCIDTGKTYTATVTTDVGDFAVELDAKRAPNAVNNFVVLSRYHFYDGLTFHRVVKDFVIQGGDPQGTGAGGPGYTFQDEGLPGTKYPAGSVAMANSGPNTNGSQFFVVTADAGGANLKPDYIRFGTVTKGMDVVKKIEANPGVVNDPNGGPPPDPIHKIIKITIEES